MSDIQSKLTNPHRIFWSNFLALISSREWQANHPTSKAGFHRLNCQRFITGTNDRPVGNKVLDKKYILENFTRMVIEAVRDDPAIQVPEESLAWAVDVISTHDTLSLTLVWGLSTTPPHYITPAEAAMQTETAESSWRNKCASGVIEGAVKKGKQWLIPDFALLKSHVGDVGRPTKSDWHGDAIVFPGFDTLPEQWTDDQYNALRQDVQRRIKFVARLVGDDVQVEQRDIRPGESFRIAVRPEHLDVYVYLLATDSPVFEWSDAQRDLAVNLAVDMLEGQQNEA